MNKTEFIQALAEKADAPKAAVTKCYDAFIATLTDALLNGDGKVDFPGFGKFEVKDVPAREGINPATGEKIQIAATKKVSFKAHKALKENF